MEPYEYHLDTQAILIRAMSLVASTQVIMNVEDPSLHQVDTYMFSSVNCTSLVKELLAGFVDISI